MLLALSSATRTLIAYWANSKRLFEHALQVTENNFFAHYGLGHVYTRQGKTDQALFHLSRATQLRPDKTTLQNDLGRVLFVAGKFEAAIACFSKALAILKIDRTARGVKKAILGGYKRWQFQLLKNSRD